MDFSDQWFKPIRVWELLANILLKILILKKLKSSHLRDELLMLLGFLSFKGFPIKNSCVHCVWCVDLSTALVIVIYAIVCKILRIHANAKIFNTILPGWVNLFARLQLFYIFLIKFISNCCTGFPILGFIWGFPYPKHCVYFYVIVVDVSQYLLSVAILVKEIHVWLSV